MKPEMCIIGKTFLELWETDRIETIQTTYRSAVFYQQDVLILKMFEALLEEIDKLRAVAINDY